MLDEYPPCHDHLKFIFLGQPHHCALCAFCEVDEPLLQLTLHVIDSHGQGFCIFVRPVNLALLVIFHVLF